MPATAARILIDTLRLHGVDRFFCVPGESYLAVMNELVDHPVIDVVTCRHEGGAAFMALADAKCTGRPGVVFASRGPGATNASVAIHSASQGAVPMVVFLGQVGTRVLGRGHTQEMDFTKTFADMAKSIEQVNRPERIGEIVARAFRIAASGTPGPVIVALPTDVLEAETEAQPVAPRVPTPAHPSAADVATIAELIAGAARPVLIPGGLVGPTPEARGLLREVAERWGLPVMPTYEHQDVFPNAHPSYAGELGIRPPMGVRETVWNADVILAVGTRLGAVPTLNWSYPKPGQRLVHVYPDPTQIGTRHETELGVIADPVPFLRALGERNAPPLSEARRAWLAGAHTAWAEAAGVPPIEAEDGIDFGHVIEAMKGLVPKDAVVTSDAGNFMSWLHHRYPFESTQLLLGSEIGAMGMGIPAAVAAAIRFPDRQVVALAGDGGALMTGSELATAVMRKARVRVIVANNNHYGTIRFHQEVHFPGRAHYANELVNPDFAAYAESFGAKGFRADRPEEVGPAIEAALAVDGPAVIDVRTSLEKITSGTTLAEMRRAAAE